MGEITGQPVFFVRKEGRGKKKRATLKYTSYSHHSFLYTRYILISYFSYVLKHGMSFGVISATVLLLNHRKRKKERGRITVVPILLLRRDQIS